LGVEAGKSVGRTHLHSERKLESRRAWFWTTLKAKSTMNNAFEPIVDLLYWKEMPRQKFGRRELAIKTQAEGNVFPGFWN
jgi:hypothetical protein